MSDYQAHVSARDRRPVVAALGIIQILSWGSSFYLLAVLATPIAHDTGWPYPWIMAGVSVGLLVAGLVSPRVGKAIGALGGRPIIALGSVVVAAGLCVIGCAPNLVTYVAGWCVVGVGMGATLYDAAFSTLGKLYGLGARTAITAVTLYGGFASTVCWPLSAYLVALFGWRGACFAYAAIHIGVSAPLCLIFVPRPAPLPAGIAAAPPTSAKANLTTDERVILVILGCALTVSASVLSLMGAHLLTLLQAHGVALAEAVRLGMIVGPSAVGARFIEMLAGERYHAIWTMIASVVLVAIGSLLFFVGEALFGIAIAIYAAGNGIGSIAKGTVPLALFGAARYPALMGQLALPILLAMAIAPFAGAVAFTWLGAAGTLAILAALASGNLVLVVALFAMTRPRRR